MTHLRSLLLLVFLLPVFCASSQPLDRHVFKVIPLGVKGGIDESNLSAYMLAPEGSHDFVCLDAGTLHYGIEQAVKGGVFKVGADQVLKSYIRAYLVSHAHLDHVAGLVINSPDDSSKNIYGLPHCINVLRNKYFTWESWANFADEGDKPMLKKYHYAMLDEGKETSIEHTSMRVTAFSLSHSSPYQSTAFLVGYKDDYILYLGDTGADEIEKSDKLALLWKQVAPLIKAGKLRAIFIEVSYPDEQPAAQLFGHLTPRLLMQEMNVLSKQAGSLKGLNIAVTHMKPSGNHDREIMNQLKQQNALQLKLSFPEQGKMVEF